MGPHSFTPPSARSPVPGSSVHSPLCAWRGTAGMSWTWTLFSAPTDSWGVLVGLEAFLLVGGVEIGDPEVPLVPSQPTASCSQCPVSGRLPALVAGREENGTLVPRGPALVKTQASGAEVC